MMRPKILYSLLQIFILFSNINLYNCETLRLDWNWINANNKELDFAKAAIQSSWALKEIDGEYFNVLEYARLKSQKDFLVVLCEVYRSNLKFMLYAGITQKIESSQQTVELNSIGSILECDSYDYPSNKVKFEAELYSQSTYAFQPHWQDFPKDQITFGILQHFEVPRTFAARIDGNELKPIKFWTVVQGKELVVLYANNDGRRGAYATIALNPISTKPEVVEYEVNESSFAEIFDALFKCLESGLAFAQGWKLASNKHHMGPSGSTVADNTPWLKRRRERAVLKPYARIQMVTPENKDLAATIFQTPGSYGVNTIFIIWKIKDSTSSNLVHVSLPGTLKETLSSYASYCKRKLWSGVASYKQGVTWWENASDFFKSCKLDITTIETKIQQSDSKIGKATILYGGLLPNSSDTNYEVKQSVCVIFQNDEKIWHFALVSLLISGNPTIPQVNVEDVVTNFKMQDEKSSKEFAQKILKYRVHPYSLKWTRGAPKKFNMKYITKSFMFPSKTKDHEIVFYFENNPNLLVIIKCGALNMEKAATFVALKKTNTEYRVTWFGSLIEIDEYCSTEKAIHQSKKEGEAYHFKSTFAYQHNWELTGIKMWENDDKTEIIKELCSWTIQNTEHKVKIFVKERAYKTCWFYWYVPFVSDVSGLPGIERIDIAGVLEDLAAASNSPLLFSKQLYKADMGRFKVLRMQEIIDHVDENYSESGDIFFENLIFPASDPLRAVLVLNETNEDIVSPGIQVFKNDRFNGVYYLLPMIRLNGQFARCGVATKVLGDWRSLARNQLLDPLAFLPQSKKNRPPRVFSNEEVELILDSAPWKTNLVLISVEYEKRVYCIQPGTSIYTCYLGKNNANPKFLVVWNHHENNVRKKLRYVSGLGTTEDVKTDIARYVSSMLAFHEIEFKRGIAWYDNTTPKVNKLLDVIIKFLQTEYFRKERDVEFLQKWSFGQISTPLGKGPQNVFTYCLLGNKSRDEQAPAYISIVIKVKETMHGAMCISFKEETRMSILQAENDLSKYNAQYHMLMTSG